VKNVELVDVVQYYKLVITQYTTYGINLFHDKVFWSWVILSCSQASIAQQFEENTAIEIANFQQKILPIDMLNMCIQEACKLKHRNGDGKRKQDLIVCACTYSWNCCCGMASHSWWLLSRVRALVKMHVQR